jgi:hypothetical protein
MADGLTVYCAKPHSIKLIIQENVILHPPMI